MSESLVRVTRTAPLLVIVGFAPNPIPIVNASYTASLVRGEAVAAFVVLPGQLRCLAYGFRDSAFLRIVYAMTFGFWATVAPGAGASDGVFQGLGFRGLGV